MEIRINGEVYEAEVPILVHIDDGEGRGQWILTEQLVEDSALLSDFALSALGKLDQAMETGDAIRLAHARQEFWVASLILLKRKHEL